MIRKIHVSALKSIRDLKVELSNLTLFVGTNSSGKSTLLQAILLLAQNSGEHEGTGLNGKWISLGEFREVRNYYMSGQPISIKIWEDSQEVFSSVEFEEDKEHESYTVKCSLRNAKIQEAFKLHYLSCHRIGANDIYAKNMMGAKNFGIDGEYALAYLLKNEGMPIAEKIAVQHSNITNSLLDQVNYWLNYIVGTTMQITDLKKTNYLQVKYNNNPENASSDALYCRPVNVGSGISYLISIIITCLGSEEDSVIIIENPEIHLHPKAQSRLCEFLYFTSQSGRQILLETHSDHIFNGIRAGVAEGNMKQEDISVNFFAVNDQYETQCNPIVFGPYGKIIGTNEEMDINDLFDQFEIDLNRMLGL